MKPKYFVILFVVAVIIFGAVKLFSDSTPTKTSESPSINNANSIDGRTSGGPVNSNKYIEYSQDIIESNKNKRRILYFYASWCPTCRPADANFKENADKIPEDVVLIRVNYNDQYTDPEEKALANKYFVTYQHTFVQIDAIDSEITKWNGGQLEELLKNIR